MAEVPTIHLTISERKFTPREKTIALVAAYILSGIIEALYPQGIRATDWLFVAFLAVWVNE